MNQPTLNEPQPGTNDELINALAALVVHALRVDSQAAAAQSSANLYASVQTV